MKGAPVDFQQERIGWARTAVVPLAALVLVAGAYWPVLQGGFVWDDLIGFVWNDWLTHGEQWKEYIFRGFNFWEHYFRPLVVALFTLQLRLFDSDPGAMHAVSLGLHLANVLLVGWLALRVSDAVGRPAKQRLCYMAVAMLAYGLHPALIESVAWIGCQFDLIMTMFGLLALLANSAVAHPIARPLAVAACFFLAACSKEAAIAIPPLLVLFAWACEWKQGVQARAPDVRDFVTCNASTWIAVLLAGLVYLAFRQWALGNAMPPADESLSWLARLQLAAFTYLRYWGLILVPSIGMGPIHPYPIEPFLQVTLVSLVPVALAMGVIVWALVAAYRRGSGLACLVLAVTASLVPVIRLLPTGFDPNLFHYRYLTCALAALCAMLPLLRPPSIVHGSGSLRLSFGLLAAAWVLSSAVAIRATLPLWASEISLWYWALQRNPESSLAASQLLGALLEAERWQEARALADRVIVEHPGCTNCLINSALLALIEGNEGRAKAEFEVLLDRQAEIEASAFMSGKMDRLQQGLEKARR